MKRESGTAGERDVNRREFVGTTLSAALAGLPLLGAVSRFPAFPLSRPHYPLGIQLYTCRELLEKDFEGTLARLAKYGCQEVEFAGTYGHAPAEVRGILDHYHLTAPSGHCDIPAVTDKLSETVATAKTLGHHYVVVAWIPDEMRTAAGYAQVAKIFNQAGADLKKAGLTLGYHNHSFEFDPLDGGRTGYDILLERTDPKLVTMELDLYWIRHAGKDPLAYFARHKGRFSLVHVKDMDAKGAMVDVGAGVMDWPGLLAAARTAGVRHAFIEHDEARDPLAFAQASFGYMQRLKAR